MSGTLPLLPNTARASSENRTLLGGGSPVVRPPRTARSNSHDSDQEDDEELFRLKQLLKAQSNRLRARNSARSISSRRSSSNPRKDSTRSQASDSDEPSTAATRPGRNSGFSYSRTSNNNSGIVAPSLPVSSPAPFIRQANPTKTEKNAPNTSGTGSLLSIRNSSNASFLSDKEDPAGSFNAAGGPPLPSKLTKVGQYSTTSNGNKGSRRESQSFSQPQLSTTLNPRDKRGGSVEQFSETGQVEVKKIVVEPIMTKTVYKRPAPQAPEVVVQQQQVIHSFTDSFASKQARWRSGRKREVSIFATDHARSDHARSDTTRPDHAKVHPPQTPNESSINGMDGNHDHTTVFSQLDFFSGGDTNSSGTGIGGGGGGGGGGDNDDLVTLVSPSAPRTIGFAKRSFRDFEVSMASLALGRMSMASCSMQRVTDGAMAIMEMLSAQPDVLLPSPSETSVVRRGDVLSNKHILKVDLQDAMRDRSGTTGMIAGGPYFRIVPKLNIAGCAQPNVSAVRTILNELKRSYVKGPVIWINLREEPLVYINNEAHIVRERQDPLKPIIIPNVTSSGIEAVEEKLKIEVLQEAEENGGNISVHLENRDGLMEDKWESAGPNSVFTISDAFMDVAQSLEGPLELQYYRRPITQNVGPQPEDFDFVLDACLDQPDAVFIFNCQSGRGRTSAMMQIASIVRFYQLCVKDVAADIRVLRSSNVNLTFKTIQKLVSLFPDGKLHERRLTVLMEMADKVYSMADHINSAFEDIANHGSTEVAMMRLQLYAYFLVFSYYCEQRLWNNAVKSSFTDWLEQNSDIKMLIMSVRQQLDEQLQAEKITAAESVESQPEIYRLVRRRKGNVLSSGRILCCMPAEKDSTNIRALRQLAPDVPVFTCGRVNQRARMSLVSEIRMAFPKHKQFHWISLRAEPMIILNDISYILADYSNTEGDSEGIAMGATMHVSLSRIEEIEERLRRDVLLESQEYGGTIVVHQIEENGNRRAKRVKVLSVRTSKSNMEDFADENDVIYHRVPIPFSGQMLASDVDPLLKYLATSCLDPEDIIVINDSEGSTRTSVALNLATMYRAQHLKPLRSLQTPESIAQTLRIENTGALIPSASLCTATVNTDENPPEHIEILLASTICQMLMAGGLLHSVDAVISLGGKGRGQNILHKVDYMKKRISTVGLKKKQAILDALHALRCYLLILLVAIYLDEHGKYSEDETFNQWYLERSEVRFIVDHLESRGEEALKYVSNDNLMKADLSRRNGDVLTANFCMKADHFPGCQKKGIRPVVCGAPNFRKVSFINVYGVAIPTLLGVHNVLSLLGASEEPMQVYPGEENDKELYLGYATPHIFDPYAAPEEYERPLKGSVVWVNLREEPLLYVGDRPCVFRDLSAPYVNVELTGIQTDKIEQVESKLKVDVLHEAKMYNGNFLIHDEGNPGELVGSWEVANEDTIKTVREVYDELAAKGFRCRMIRLPVTDEQSPDISDFDALTSYLLPQIVQHDGHEEPLSFVFNCQMGRGRTTTGMVICTLIIGMVIPGYYDELHAMYNPLYKEDESELSRGEYTVITELKRILTGGREAKYKLDLVLEACSRMQNLRTAIEALAITASSPDSTEGGRARAHHAGVHYLIRYFNLIVFNFYLHEEFDKTTKKMKRSFEAWMASHPELTTLSATAALK